MPNKKSKSQIGKASRNKGKRGELMLAHEMQSRGFTECHRSAQHAGNIESADIIGLPGLHPEAKFVEKLNVYKAYEQAVRDATGSADIPVVFHKRSRSPWLVTLDLDAFCKLYQSWRIHNSD